MESGGIGGAGAAERVRVSTRVGFARMLLDESWEGVRLIFAITGGCWARLAVDVIFGPMVFAAMARSIRFCASLTPVSCVKTVINVGDVNTID